MVISRTGSSFGPIAGMYALLLGIALLVTFAPAVIPDLSWRPERVSWVADAGIEMYDAVGWLTGFNGTVIVALYVDRTLSGSDPRPENRAQARHRAFVALVALIAASIQTYGFVLMTFARLTRDTPASTLLIAGPTTLLVVFLCLGVGARARPRLEAELDALKTYLDVNKETDAALAAAPPSEHAIRNVVLGIACPLAISLTIVLFPRSDVLRGSAVLIMCGVVLFWSAITCAVRVFVLRSPELSAIARSYVVAYSVVMLVFVEAVLRELGAAAWQSMVTSALLIAVPAVVQVFLHRETPLTAFMRTTHRTTRLLIQRGLKLHEQRLREVEQEQEDRQAIARSRLSSPLKLVDLSTGVRSLSATIPSEEHSE